MGLEFVYITWYKFQKPTLATSLGANPCRKMNYQRKAIYDISDPQVLTEFIKIVSSIEASPKFSLVRISGDINYVTILLNTILEDYEVHHGYINFKHPACKLRYYTTPEQWEITQYFKPSLVIKNDSIRYFKVKLFFPTSEARFAFVKHGFDKLMDYSKPNDPEFHIYRIKYTNPIKIVPYFWTTCTTEFQMALALARHMDYDGDYRTEFKETGYKKF